MLIVCPNCATSYQVEPSSLGASGRSVRCVRCKKTWFASNPEAIAAIARSHQDEVAAFTTTTSVGNVADQRVQPPADDFQVIDASPPPVDSPAEPPAVGVEELVRDDRGPAPLPEPVDDRGPAPPPAIEHVPAPNEPVAAATAPTVPEDIESVAARRMRRQAARRRSRAAPVWTMAILMLIAINAGLIAWRADIVRFMPQTASLYAAIGLPVNLRGLEFIDIVTRKELEDGVQMLVVEGFIRSHSRRNAEVTRLRFAVRNAAGQEIYSWTALPARTVIPPGATLPFRSRLASPPPEAHAVLVRFFNRRDIVAGLQ